MTIVRLALTVNPAAPRSELLSSLARRTRPQTRPPAPPQFRECPNQNTPSIAEGNLPVQLLRRLLNHATHLHLDLAFDLYRHAD